MYIFITICIYIYTRKYIDINKDMFQAEATICS